MEVEETSLAGVLIIKPKVFRDSRGHFFESYHDKNYEQIGLGGRFRQDNISKSHQGVMRGLHFQNPHPQGKLVQVIKGAVYDVAVDIRLNSPTFGQWVGVHLSEENQHQLYIPEGFAHGFYVISREAYFFYKCTDFYHHSAEASIRWDDPELAIRWPDKCTSISPKDATAMTLAEYRQAPQRFF